jgi:hypothetical protein
LIANDATYWFTDGSYRGREEIAGALERTFAAIQNELYEIRELEWFAANDEFAAYPADNRTDLPGEFESLDARGAAARISWRGVG